MAITSSTFILFFVSTLLIYYLLPGKWQKYHLLVASYVFLSTWSLEFTSVLLGITLIDFCLSLRLSTRKSGDKVLLWFGILVNALAFFFFKTSGFYVNDFVVFLRWIGISTNFESLPILLPLGLSFYILRSISYLVDVHRRQVKVPRNFLVFALYMAYFPTILAGPIERAHFFLAQLHKTEPVTNTDLENSFTLLLIGLFRKLVIADQLFSMIPERVFIQPDRFSTPILISWFLAYMFALYNDFAGYTDIMRGVSGFFGIRLSPNFKQPFLARNFSELFYRWHITLSHWLRDYVYFPICRALLRRNQGKRSFSVLFFPPLITMLVSGLWHGVCLNMVVWGLIMGIYLTIGQISSYKRPVIPPDERPLWAQVLRMGWVFSLCALALLCFRMELPQAWHFLENMIYGEILARPDIRVFPFLMLSLFIDWSQYRYDDELCFKQWPQGVKYVILVLALLAIFLFSVGTMGKPFIYQEF
ncbi:MBOAT family O-acyltransferase [candidate division CSSED10-310 bacterium]|uniref:MBOAT family O-acyltransferase n=1 Tax=candidate division CSSED10-310 bacterium TaxID=2855610 RepID=A0ABV6YTB7_UNCC1